MTGPGADIEVGRYGLRTFRIDRRHRVLLPITAGGAGAITGMPDATRQWQGGVCVARCRNHPEHLAPVADCTCGIYATTDLLSLHEQYPLLARNVVAVIAAEGPTMIGDRGMRTSAARVVAYWVSSHPRLQVAREVLAAQCHDAAIYTDLDSLLADYHLRSTPPPDVTAGAASTPGRINKLLAARGGAASYRAAVSTEQVLRWLKAMCLVLVLPALTGYAAADVVKAQRAGELPTEPAGPTMTAFHDLYRASGVLLDQFAASSVAITAPLGVAVCAAAAGAVLSMAGCLHQPRWLLLVLHRSIRQVASVVLAVSALLVVYTHHAETGRHPIVLAAAVLAALAYLFAPAGTAAAVLRTTPVRRPHT